MDDISLRVLLRLMVFVDCAVFVLVYVSWFVDAIVVDARAAGDVVAAIQVAWMCGRVARLLARSLRMAQFCSCLCCGRSCSGRALWLRALLLACVVSFVCVLLSALYASVVVVCGVVLCLACVASSTMVVVVVLSFGLFSLLETLFILQLVVWVLCSMALSSFTLVGVVADVGYCDVVVARIVVDVMVVA